MNSLLERLFRLRLAASLHADDSAAREKRRAELRSLLEEIAAPGCNGASRDNEFATAVGCNPLLLCDGRVGHVSA